MFTTSWTTIRRRAQTALRAAHRHLLAWIRPATGPLAGSTIGDLTGTKAALVAENAFLRQQFVVLASQVKPPALRPADRLRLVLLARLVRGWRAALLIVQPKTLLRWHRQGFRLVWRARSRGTSQRPQVSAETVATIKRLAAKNRLWGAERSRDCRFQQSRKPARCQRGTVSGRTMTSAPAQVLSRLARRTNSPRSAAVSCGRLAERLRTTSWWRSSAFSSSIADRLRVASATAPAAMASGAGRVHRATRVHVAPRNRRAR